MSLKALRRWISGWRNKRKCALGQDHARPRVEQLEDRIVPTVLSVSEAGTGSFSYYQQIPGAPATSWTGAAYPGYGQGLGGIGVFARAGDPYITSGNVYTVGAVAQALVGDLEGYDYGTGVFEEASASVNTTVSLHINPGPGEQDGQEVLASVSITPQTECGGSVSVSVNDLSQSGEFLTTIGSTITIRLNASAHGQVANSLSNAESEQAQSVGLVDVTVNILPPPQYSPTITTTTGGTVAIGSGINLTDSATLSNGYNETGTITFTLTDPSGVTVDTETVLVNGDGTYSTPTGYLPTDAGTYQWVASYSGDTNNDPVSSALGDEPETATGLTISTTTGGTVDLGGGTNLTDSATLSGGDGETGTITFTLTDPSGNTADTETVSVNGDGTYTTPAGALPTMAGIYQWVASYSGDSDNPPVDTAFGDEPVTISPLSPTITTTTGGTVAIGSGINLTDSATLSNGYNETGTITFTLTDPSGVTVDTETVLVNGDGTYSTPTGYLPTDAGTYQWVASYSGDSNNTPVASARGDEPETVNPASPTISTTTGGTVDLGSGSNLTDSATLSGGYNETGTITFTLTDPSGNTADTETVSVNGDGTYVTPTGALPTMTGTYQWVASYSGDSNNNQVASVLGDEPETVTPASPTITTTTGGTVDLGSDTNLTDSATLSDGYNETGTITFTLADPSGVTVDTETVLVNGDGTYSTPTGYLPTDAGTYQWVASYSGDSNNDPVSSAFGDEPETVSPASPTITTTTGGTVALGGGTKLTDSATLSDGYNETGTITFTLTAPGGATVDTETVSVNGDGTYSTPKGVLPTMAGTYQWVASYSGDSNNNSVADALGNEPETVVAAVTLGPLSFPQWTLNKAGYIGNISVSGGSGTYSTVSVSSGSLPPGLSPSLSGGIITFKGTPTRVGTFTFTLSVQDSLGAVGSQSYTITIDPATSLAWTGNVSNLWNNALNWSGAAPVAGDTLIFGTGAMNETNENNLAANIKLASLVFQSSGYSITGNAIELSGGLDAGNTVVGADAIALNIALTASQTFDVDGPSDLMQLQGVVSGAGLGVTKSGTGTLLYSGTAANTYTGTTTVSAGELQMDKTAGVHAIAGALTVNPGATAQYEASNQIAAAKTVTVEGTLDLNNNSDTISTLVLTGGTVNTGAGTLTLGGNLTFDASSNNASISGNLSLDGTTRTVTVASGGTGTDTIAATISNGSPTKAGSLTKAGAGTLVLSGDNTYTGSTVASAGVLAVQNASALMDSSSVTVDSGATLQLDGSGLSFSNALTLSGGTLADVTGSNTWSGKISLSVTGTFNVAAGESLTLAGTVSGAGGLNKAGTGMLIFGASNTVSSLTLTGGTLSSGTGTLTLAGNITANGTSTIIGNLSLGTATRTVTVATGDDLVITADISSGANVGLAKAGTGTLTLSGSNGYLGSTTVSGGVLDIQTVLPDTSVTVAAGATLQLDVAGVSFENSLLTLSGGTLSDNAAGNTWLGKISLAATSTVSVAAGESLTLQGVISGPGGLTKSGGGTLLMGTQTNTYSGATTINQGIVNIQTAKGLGTSAVTVDSGAALQIQGGISLANKLTLNGTGGASAGALESSSGSNTWTGTVALATASSIDVAAGSQLTISGVTSGIGSLTEIGTGTLLLSATNTFTGGTTVNAGTLGGSGKTGTGTVTVDAGATLAPGSTTTAILSTGNVTFASGSNVNVLINGTTAGSGYDQLNATGTVALNGATLNVSLGTMTVADGSSLTIIKATSVTGTFENLPASGDTITVGGETFQITYNSNSVVLTRKS
jgi:fibronectin-binding autotransporter adhesin